MVEVGYQTPWEQLEAKLDRDLARLEAKLAAHFSELASEQRVQRLAVLGLNARLQKLEEQVKRAHGLTQDDVRQALADALQDVVNLRQVLLVLGVPSGVLGLLLLVAQLVGRF